MSVSTNLSCCLTSTSIAVENPVITSQVDVTEAMLRLKECVAKIDALIGEGKNVCLFIGRTPSEKLPSDNGEAKPGEVWVSGDLGDKGAAIAPGRIHLKMDFNDQASIAILQGKFQLIVVDWSTRKFFNDDFARRFSVLLRTPASEMIFEADDSFTSVGPTIEFNTNTYRVNIPITSHYSYLQQVSDHYKQYKAATSADVQKADMQTFMTERGNAQLAALGGVRAGIRKKAATKGSI